MKIIVNIPMGKAGDELIASPEFHDQINRIEKSELERMYMHIAQMERRIQKKKADSNTS